MNIALISICAVAAAVIALVFASYVKAPPDVCYIISGFRKKRYFVGKAGLRIPFLERLDKLALKLISVDVKTTNPVPTKEYIDISVDSVVNIKVSDKLENLERAAQNFLNKPTDYIMKVACEVLEGNMREIIGQMQLQEMINDRQKFASLVKENADPDLAAMGLEIISFNVQNFKDTNGVISNMGVDNVERIRKDAQIAKANAERDVSVAKSIAAKEANDADVAAQLEIAKKQNDLRIKQAELKKESDTQMAIAEAAKGIMDEEQRKIKEIKAGDANVAAQEKIIELKEREIAITEKQLDAQVKKKADAEKYAVQMKSDAALYETQKKADADLFKRAKDAEAYQIEAEREAEAKKALAEADKVRGENEAAVIKAKGEAEAEAIRLKGIAEAEALEKKADAMAKYGEAAKMDLQLQVAKAFVEQLPAVAKGVAESYSKVDSIVMYGDQSAKLAGNVITTTTQLAEGLGKGLGIDLKSLIAGAFGTKLLDAAKKNND